MVAAALSKDRWVHHTSFLWDFKSQDMDYLQIPEKQPEYRSNRNHDDFLCRMSDFVPSPDTWWAAIEAELEARFEVRDGDACLGDISEALREHGSFRTRILEPS